MPVADVVGGGIGGNGFDDFAVFGGGIGGIGANGADDALGGGNGFDDATFGSGGTPHATLGGGNGFDAATFGGGGADDAFGGGGTPDATCQYACGAGGLGTIGTPSGRHGTWKTGGGGAF